MEIKLLDHYQTIPVFKQTTGLDFASFPPVTTVPLLLVGCHASNKSILLLFLQADSEGPTLIFCIASWRTM
jgi:hypothetical protein